MTAAPTTGYRRAIAIRAIDPDLVEAEMEDDFHHFRVALHHREGFVARVEAEAVRHPWSLCPAAAARLNVLVGSALTPVMADALGRSNVRDHCTHMYDLACLAIVYAAKGVRARRWDMAVNLPAPTPRRARLSVDGRPALAWTIVGSDILEHGGMSLKGDFVTTVTARMAPDEAEQSILLRRAIFVSGGRRRDLDERATAADGARNLGSCFVMQPQVAARATRMRGSSRQFDAGLVPLAGD